MVIHCHASFLGYAVISLVPACEQVPAVTYDNTAGYRLGNGGKLGLNGPKMHNTCKNKIKVPTNHLPCTIYYVPFAGWIYFQAH